ASATGRIRRSFAHRDCDVANSLHLVRHGGRVYYDREGRRIKDSRLARRDKPAVDPFGEEPEVTPSSQNEPRGACPVGRRGKLTEPHISRVVPLLPPSTSRPSLFLRSS